MNIRNADINAENSLYEFCKKFGENNEACDFLLKHTEGDNIFIASDTEIKAVFFVCDKLVYKNKEGIFIYPVFDGKSPLLDNEIREIFDYMENRYKKDFYIVKANGFSDSSYSESMEYSPVKHRNFTYEIKKNIWQNADFDIVSASRFPTVRDKFRGEDIVHYTKPEYEKYALYMYSTGGSTAENEHAYCVYFIQGDAIVVKEIFSENTTYAVKLLQAVRERCGCEKAKITLSENSNLFLGEGVLEAAYYVKGLESPYVNLMFD
ncbi:MAG: hypothetical protein PUB11_06230 [Oscillospiraceae bacterium]|nr:hypothetical protein [Oscillospiraceae bacterium]